MVLGVYYLTMNQNLPQKGDGRVFGDINEVLLAYQLKQVMVHTKIKLRAETIFNDQNDLIESDLGERIIQLVGEHPSHIIVPAVHKTKEEIGRILHDKLGLPLTTVPEEMTAGVRESLRHDFLQADLGISGVNFGVAATGTLSLVENEGNGRLSTTTPRIVPPRVTAHVSPDRLRSTIVIDA